MKALMLILGLLGVGALGGAVDADDATERMFDLAFTGVAAAVIGIYLFVNQSRRQALTDFWKGPGRAILIYAIALPAIVYWVVTSALNLDSVSKEMLAAVVGLGGLGLAVWRYWST